MSIMQGALVGRLVARLGEEKLITIGTFTMIFGLGLMPFAPSMMTYCCVIGLMSFGAGVNNPSITGLLSRSCNVDEQGGIMGVAQSMASLARVLGPVWGGFAFGSIGMHWPFVSAGILMALACLMSLKYLAARRNALQITGTP